MLSLGIVHKWPLPSLIRICENGKLKIAPILRQGGSLISLRPLFALSALSTDPSAYGTSPNLGEEWSDGSGNKNVTREEGGSLQGLGY